MLDFKVMFLNHILLQYCIVKLTDGQLNVLINPYIKQSGSVMAGGCILNSSVLSLM